MSMRLGFLLSASLLATISLTSVARAQSASIEKHSESSSTESRGDKQFGVGGRAGILMGGIPGGGIEGFYALSPSFQLGAFAGSGEVDLADKFITDRSIQINEAKVSVQVAQLTGKYFLGNTFSASFGLGYRQIDISADVESIFGPRFISNVEVSGPYSMVAIGNTWTWDSGFYLGTDWVGICYPFANGSKSEASGRAVSDESLQSVQEEQAKFADDIRKSPLLSSLMLHLGVMF